MTHHLTNRLAGTLIGGAAAAALFGLTATAHAVTVDPNKFSVTLTGSQGASVKACYSLDPSNLDVDEGIEYIEQVDLYGDDQHDTVHSDDDFLVRIYSANRTFSSTTPINNICRSKTLSDRDELNEDTGLGQDEIYAKISLVPTDPQLKPVHKKSKIVSLRV
jgi:hypothetical protein